MNGITELAMLLKNRDNISAYSPVFGTIIDLPEIKIQIGDKIIIDKSHIATLSDLFAQNEDGEYSNLGQKVALLPYASNQKYIVLGVIRNVSSN